MKVLHVLASDRFSGAENVACQIIEMARRGAGVDSVYCSPDGQIRAALERRGIRFVPVERLSCAQLRRVIRQERPELIHAHDMRASFVAALSQCGIPMVSHIHNNNFDSRRCSVKSLAYCLAAARAERIIWVSEGAHKGYRFHRSFDAKSEVLNNCVDVEALYASMRQDARRYDYDVIFIGRLTYQKNPQRMLDVLAKVVERMPELRVAVVGTGELEEEARSYARKLKLDGAVSFLGFQENPLKMLHDAKLMLMTSRWEGLPICGLEAAALGVPVVGTPVEGMAAFVEEGVTGYLSDDDEALAGHVMELVTNDALREKMKATLLARAKDNAGARAYQRRILEIYADCVR